MKYATIQPTLDRLNVARLLTGTSTCLVCFPA
jgi:hypothetical protein